MLTAGGLFVGYRMRLAQTNQRYLIQRLVLASDPALRLAFPFGYLLVPIQEEAHSKTLFQKHKV